MTRTTITEAVAAPAPTQEKTGRLSIGIITPGWGSSGYYSQKVLENAATDKVWPAGTQMYLDHPSESEMFDRPERSVKDLAAVLTEDAYWDGTGLVAEAQVFAPYRDLLTDENFTESVGVSIRATAETTTGVAEGRKGQIITRLVEGESVDFVTKAGRGGRVLAVLESARAASRAVARGVAEATANDTREALQDVLQSAYGAEKSWVWVRDFDESTVWFTHETPDDVATYAQDYELADDGTATLAGDRVEVRIHTEYVPVSSSSTSAADEATPDVPAPAGQSTATESQEGNMATTQIEESRLAQLERDSERVQALESERDTAVRERDELREANARRARHDRALALVADRLTESDSDVTFTPLEERGLTAELPLTEKGELDEAKFTKAVDKAIAGKAREAGAGTITGFGASAPVGTGDVSEADVQKHVAATFGRQIKEA